MGERRVGGGSAPARCSRDATRPPAARRDASPGRAGPGRFAIYITNMILYIYI